MNRKAISRGAEAARAAGIDTGDEADVVDHITDLLLWARSVGYDDLHMARMVEVHVEAESGPDLTETWQNVCREISRCYPNSYGHQGTIYIDVVDRNVVMVDQDNGDARIGVYPVVDNEVAEDPSEFHELDLLDHTADSIMARLHDIVDIASMAPLDDDGNCTRCGAPQRGCEH